MNVILMCRVGKDVIFMCVCVVDVGVILMFGVDIDVI